MAQSPKLWALLNWQIVNTGNKVVNYKEKTSSSPFRSNNNIVSHCPINTNRKSTTLINSINSIFISDNINGSTFKIKEISNLPASIVLLQRLLAVRVRSLSSALSHNSFTLKNGEKWRGCWTGAKRFSWKRGSTYLFRTSFVWWFAISITSISWHKLCQN